MKLGIMQPYFLPYLGYWQLLAMVDKYIVLDDVNYIKGGWINRNRILINGKVSYITVPVYGASPNKKINELELFQKEKTFKRLYKTVNMGYKKAPYHQKTMYLLEQILTYEGQNLSDFLIHTIKIICRYLEINTELILASDIDPEKKLKGKERVIFLGKKLKTDEYINAEGGVNLYDKWEFEKNNIKLWFLKSQISKYPQFAESFVGGLSILDVLMFNSKEDISRMLREYRLF